MALFDVAIDGKLRGCDPVKLAVSKLVKGCRNTMALTLGQNPVHKRRLANPKETGRDSIGGLWFGIEICCLNMVLHYCISRKLGM